MDGGYRRLLACRLCGGEQLRQYMDFGCVALGNNLQPAEDMARAAATYPLALARCARCGHFQLEHAVDPKLLYATNYTYLSGIGPSFIKHFDEYARWVVSTCSLPENGLVVDVGSNDGTCLKAFQSRGFRVCGVDPASLPAEVAVKNGIDTINVFFDDSVVAEIRSRYGLADFITSHNVLAHVDDLPAVFRNIKSLLKGGAYFAFEVGYFREVLASGHFDTIYHEHLDYHHAGPLVRHLTELGFDVISLSVNAVQGGSLRLLLRNTGDGKISDSAQQFLADERNSILYDASFLAEWRERIEQNMRALRELVRARISAGRAVAGYGSPTKVVLLMKMAGIGVGDVKYVVEDNPYKVGRFLPSTGIPIKAPDELDNNPPDVLVLFAWNFADDIIDRLQRKQRPRMEVVIPLPHVACRVL